MIYPLDVSKMPCLASLVAGLASVYKEAPGTWTPVEMMMSSMTWISPSAECPTCQQQGPTLSPLYDTIFQGPAANWWLLDYIRLHDERDSSFPSGKCFMFRIGICFPTLQICQLCWLADTLFIAIISHITLPPPKVYISGWNDIWLNSMKFSCLTMCLTL